MSRENDAAVSERAEDAIGNQRCANVIINSAQRVVE